MAQPVVIEDDKPDVRPYDERDQVPDVDNLGIIHNWQLEDGGYLDLRKLRNVNLFVCLNEIRLHKKGPRYFI